MHKHVNCIYYSRLAGTCMHKNHKRRWWNIWRYLIGKRLPCVFIDDGINHPNYTPVCEEQAPYISSKFKWKEDTH